MYICKKQSIHNIDFYGEKVKILFQLSSNTLTFRKDRSEQTVKALFRLLLEEQSEQGLHCLLLHLQLLEAFFCCKTNLYDF